MFVIKRKKNAKENSVNITPLLGEFEIKATSFGGGILLMSEKTGRIKGLNFLREVNSKIL